MAFMKACLISQLTSKSSHLDAFLRKSRYLKTLNVSRGEIISLFDNILQLKLIITRQLVFDDDFYRAISCQPRENWVDCDNSPSQLLQALCTSEILTVAI